jgi:hypothetical protein
LPADLLILLSYRGVRASQGRSPGYADETESDTPSPIDRFVTDSGDGNMAGYGRGERIR